MKSRCRVPEICTISLIVVSLLSFLTACTPKHVGRPSVLPAGGEVAAAPTAQGTVSGGGGNGCDGKAFESYAQKITSFEEYRLYIQPLLRRMVEGGNDPLASYLTWVAEETVWYFIPCQLERLSKEQIGLAIDSDQLARHGEHGIYIHGDKNDDRPLEPKAVNSRPKHYFNQRLKARAALLLHEMVMGARLLMKKSPKEQCKMLARMESELCANQELMAIAETFEVDPSQSMIMNADDHEAVRAMTAYLAERGADVSAEKVWQTRQRLKFQFPWDRAVSRMDVQGFAKAVSRSMVDGDKFIASSKTDYLGEFAAACTLHASQEEDEFLWLDLVVASALPISTTSHELAEKWLSLLPSRSYQAGCLEERGLVVPKPRWGGQPCKDQVFSWSNLNVQIQFQSSQFRAHGVLRNGKLVDEIAVTQAATNKAYSFQGKKPNVLVIKLYVTREARPKLESIVIEPKGVLRDDALKRRNEDAKPSSPAGIDEGELFEIPGLDPLECKAGSAAPAGVPGPE